MLVLRHRGVNLGYFPPPYQAVLRIDDLADRAKPAFREDSRRSTRLRERVGANDPNPFVGEREADERLGRFRCVPVPLMPGLDSVSDLHDPVGARRPLEPAHTNHRTGGVMNDAEAERPWIGFRGGVRARKPIR